MFAINYFGNKKRIIDNVEDERNEMGSQSRIYDYNTGICQRGRGILAQLKAIRLNR